MKQEIKNENDITPSNLSMDQKYWDTRWKNKETGWDIGYASPVITDYIDGIQDKNIAILIPGCGNAYEAEYLVQNGFTDITLIDFAPLAVEQLKQKFKGNVNIKILCENFFDHEGCYDLILEQTFLSAILPTDRNNYVLKMHDLLKINASLVGVLFNKNFNNPFPPFGGNVEEYNTLFKSHFTINTLELCYNSIAPRKGNEVFINLTKKEMNEENI